MVCNLCPKKCGATRDEKTALGNCQMPTKLKIAHFELFAFEEPCISLGKGSGAIFFSGCNLNCVFCQNYTISHLGMGKFITELELVDIFKELEDMGAENINLVSPMHYALQIINALKIYKPKVPVIYNTNAYENTEVIKMLAPYVDIFLPDFKYYSSSISKTFSNVEDYYSVALNCIKTMRELKQDVYDEYSGKMLQGVLIRHLILPLCTDDSIKILETIKNEIPSTKVSLMCQYTPMANAEKFKTINRTITRREYNKVLSHFYALNLNGYMQELSSAKETYVPKFKFV